MGHWFLSNIPWKALAVYGVVGLVTLGTRGVDDYGFIAFVMVGVLFFSLFILITHIRLNYHYDAVIRNIIIPEFMDKRPFREFNTARKEVILEEILANVNNSVNLKLKTDYSFTNTIDLVIQYNECMDKFKRQLDKLYAEVPDEEIKGWDKFMLAAKNMADEDIEYAINNAYSPDLIQKYCKRENNSNNNIINERQDILSRNQLSQNRTS
ncbi:uncharacterized protein AC631_05834 [Debaryomyces fabryi]|uniref:Uncharacterized protein n=1 Tax=Debaryomyces fabryi TaxID=58627 RepID=A0A0V1PQ86_9ASCO|nr:uncharacterized protein AC631_05834 [Debaryomyces fabryi]KRZ98406.1 hypothetical protein AC631_05834 [Debaryomyces fabryi]CUM45836.1 unnamed protein product [Debaryomyces fabryi]